LYLLIPYGFHSYEDIKQESNDKLTHSPSLDAVKCFRCHKGMVRPQVTGGGDSLQIWWIATNILN